MDTRQKITPFSDSAALESGEAVAYGRFDVLTSEHCRALAALKADHTAVIAAVDDDSPERATLLDAKSRAQLVAALGAVDRVIICDVAQREQLVAAIEPSAKLDIEAGVTRDVVSDVLAKHSAAD